MFNISSEYKNIVILILIIILLFLFSNEPSFNNFFQKKQSLQYLFIFFLIYLTYYQFNISLLLLPFLFYHISSQPNFKEKIMDLPVLQQIDNKIKVFLQEPPNSTSTSKLKIKEDENQEDYQQIKIIEEVRRNMEDFGNLGDLSELKVEEIYDENETQSTNLKQLKGGGVGVGSGSEGTELSFEELQELYVSISMELKELENKK